MGQIIVPPNPNPGTHEFFILPSTDTCSGTTLATNQSCNMSIGFIPGQEGERVSTIRVKTSDPYINAGLYLSGTGKPATYQQDALQCVIGWAKNSWPDYFPRGGVDVALVDLRGYCTSGTFLDMCVAATHVNGDDSQARVLYHNKYLTGGQTVDLGPLAHWKTVSNCPTQP